MRGSQRRTKDCQSRCHACAAGGCGGAENLSVPEAPGTGTGAIRQECLMHSRLWRSSGSGLAVLRLPRSGRLRDAKIFAHPHRCPPHMHDSGSGSLSVL